MSDETAVVKREAREVSAHNPTMGAHGFDFDFAGAWRFAQGLIDGGMAPRGMDKAGAVVGLMQAGKELGLSPMYALANLTFTNGRLGIMGDAAKALIRRSGLLEPGTDFREEYSGKKNTPEWTCTVTAHRRGMKEPVSRSFSIQDAIDAGIARINGDKIESRKGREWSSYGPWSTYTARMLMYRATGFLARDYFADALGGCVVMEELQDYPAISHRPEVRDITPPAEPDPLLAVSASVEPEPADGEGPCWEPMGDGRCGREHGHRGEHVAEAEQFSLTGDHR